MQPARSHHLTVLLALGLGASLSFALSTTNAEGYPASAVSRGTNPVFSKSDYIPLSDGHPVVTAPADQALIITDVSLGLSHSHSENCRGMVAVKARTAADRKVADMVVSMGNQGNNRNVSTTHNFMSGLRLDPGEELRLNFTSRWVACSYAVYRLSYTFSGYFAEP